MSRRIFRESALRRYNERLERVELPRYATMPWTLLGWATVCLLILLAVLMQSIQLPVYAEGPGVVIGYDGAATDAAVMALLPAEYASQLQRGQSAQLELPQGADQKTSDPIEANVLAVESQVLSPSAARQKYDLDAATGSLIEGPVAVAIIPLDQPTAEWAGSVVDVRVEIGTRSGLAFLPGIGRLFATEANAASPTEREQ